MAYTPSTIANTFLWKAKQEGVDIDHLKLQKLVYCLNGWNLAVRGEPVTGEGFEAWPYGPVISSLYHKLKKFGAKKVDEFIYDTDPRTGEPQAYKVSNEDRDFYEVFDRVWNRYKNFSGLQLSSMTHAPETPWSKARERQSSYLFNDDIKEHYTRLAQRAAA